jgi:hypothetical protein
MKSDGVDGLYEANDDLQQADEIRAPVGPKYPMPSRGRLTATVDTRDV